ncbi:MAG: hypothetical protein J6R00_00560 [Lentisphaeria bacterium]|nr:hypothetical protein [Lentisphaeria bacterium]
MKTVLQITPSGARTVDSYGDTSVHTPELMLHTCVDLVFDLRSVNRNEEGALEKFVLSPGAVAGWYFAIDSDYISETSPKLLIISGITLETSEKETILTVPVADTGTAELVNDLEGKASGKYTAEIGALDAEGRNVYTWQFGVVIKNRIYNGGGTASVPSPPEGYTALQINAMLAAKADAVSVYTKSEIDSMLGDVEQQLGGI